MCCCSERGEVMDLFLFLTGFLLSGVSFVLMIIKMVKKQDFRRLGVVIIIGFVFMIIGLFMPSKPKAAPLVQLEQQVIINEENEY